MKKILAFMLVSVLLFSGCSKKLVTPSESPTPSETPTAETELADKMNDTTYAGKVTEITDTSITILMDEKVSETFDLNEKAKSDIRILKIEKDNRVIINFDSAENRNITGVELITSE